MAKLVCIRGHERTPENVNRFGQCKECNALRMQANRESRRLMEPKKRGAKKKTHCIRGHERTPENVNRFGQCIPCNSMHAMAVYYTKKDDPEYRADHVRRQMAYQERNQEKIIDYQQKKYQKKLNDRSEMSWGEMRTSWMMCCKECGRKILVPIPTKYAAIAMAHFNGWYQDPQQIWYCPDHTGDLNAPND